MSLNDYKEEVKDFLQKINSLNENTELKLNWLEEELLLLKDAVDKDDKDKVRHQIYDMLFILFEITVDYDLDLDSEWNIGRNRKQEKYLPNL
jgi:NTP pyrophosphatase (non-canonical NTP hydrolase)